MPRFETPPVFFRVLPAGVVLAVLPFLASCGTLIDELRIRTDPNTIVKPDVDELRDIEIAEGTYIEEEPVVMEDVETALANVGMIEMESPAARQGGYPGGNDGYTPIVPPSAVMPASVARPGYLPAETGHPPAGSGYPAAGPGDPLLGAPPAPPAPPFSPSSRPTVSPPSQDPSLPPQYDPSVIEELR